MFSAAGSLRWRPLRQHTVRPTKAWRHWLMDTGSLTQRLRALSQGDFRVEVLVEEWRTYPVPDLLDCFPEYVLRQRMWSRQVLLYGRGEPWVKAHSLIPQASLDGSLRCLPKLRNKPLGAFLFRHKQLRRRPLQVSPADDCWGRRSIFLLADRPLLVAEFFLPALIHYAESNRSSGFS